MAHLVAHLDNRMYTPQARHSRAEG